MFTATTQRDEKIFFKGVDRLEKAGIPASRLMVYMLVGYDPAETWERIFHRFDRMVERGILPYPMVYNSENAELKRFQRWVIRGYYNFIPWAEYRRDYYRFEKPEQQLSLKGV